EPCRCSSDSSWSKLLRKFVGIAGIRDIDLPGICRIRERKIVGLDLVPSLPVSNLDTVLRRLFNLVGGYHVSARIWAWAMGDPDLPVDVFGPEGKMVTLRSPNYTAAEIFRIDHFRHQLVVYIRQKQIGAGNGSMMLIPQLINELIQCPG